jgi:hypothetical protein
MLPRVIPTSVHGAADYPTAATLLSLPTVAGFDPASPEAAVLVADGIAVLGQSLLTDYEFGAARMIPVRTHLRNDVLAGAALAASPWLLGFAHRVWAPHVVLGLVQMAFGLATRTAPAPRFGGPAPAHLGRIPANTAPRPEPVPAV